MTEEVTDGNSPWPAGYCGVVSLTFDDGRASQLVRAVPLLEAFGLPATFYLNPTGADENTWRAGLAPWSAVQAAGHEIGNHSLSHVCSESHHRLPNPLKPCLEQWTLADVEVDVLEAERRLTLALGAGPFGQRSFCYPCYQDHVGRGSIRQSYVPVIARHFVAARAMGERFNWPLTCDLHHLSSWPTENMSGSELIGRAEYSVLGGWIIFAFHDIGSPVKLGHPLSGPYATQEADHLSNSEFAFRELCAFLARRRDQIWVAPVTAVAQHLAVWQQRGSSVR